MLASEEVARLQAKGIRPGGDTVSAGSPNAVLPPGEVRGVDAHAQGDVFQGQPKLFTAALGELNVEDRSPRPDRLVLVDGRYRGVCQTVNPPGTDGSWQAGNAIQAKSRVLPEQMPAWQ